jgi:hypothetical protein
MPPKQQLNKKKEKEEDEAFTVAKSKANKKDKDPNAIKRPTSAYFAFMNATRAATKAKNPNASMTDQTKLMTTIWKAQSEKERAKWDKVASDDK